TRHRAPTAQRANELDDVAGESLAARAEANGAPTLDPAVGIEQAAQYVESYPAIGAQIRRRYELVVAADSTQTQRCKRLHARIGIDFGDALPMRAAALANPVVDALGRTDLERLRQTFAQPGDHFRSGGGKSHTRAGKVPIAKQRTQYPRIDRQRLFAAPV